MLIAFVQDKATDTAGLGTEGNGGASVPEPDGDGYDSDTTVLYGTPEPEDCGTPGSSDSLQLKARTSWILTTLVLGLDTLAVDIIGLKEDCLEVSTTMIFDSFSRSKSYHIT